VILAPSEISKPLLFSGGDDGDAHANQVNTNTIQIVAHIQYTTNPEPYRQPIQVDPVIFELLFGTNISVKPGGIPTMYGKKLRYIKGIVETVVKSHTNESDPSSSTPRKLKFYVIQENNLFEVNMEELSFTLHGPCPQEPGSPSPTESRQAQEQPIHYDRAKAPPKLPSKRQRNREDGKELQRQLAMNSQGVNPRTGEKYVDRSAHSSHDRSSSCSSRTDQYNSESNADDSSDAGGRLSDGSSLGMGSNHAGSNRFYKRNTNTDLNGFSKREYDSAPETDYSYEKDRGTLSPKEKCYLRDQKRAEEKAEQAYAAKRAEEKAEQAHAAMYARQQLEQEFARQQNDAQQAEYVRQQYLKSLFLESSGNVV